MNFKTAIVREPGPEIIHGITSANLGRPNFEKALEQHGQYVKALEELGLEVHLLKADPRYPDGTFVEDTALCTSRCAVITNPGAPARKGEQDEMQVVLGNWYEMIEEIVPPGTLDAGDVMMAGSHFFIGLSGRTNPDGAVQLIQILEKYGFRGSTVSLEGLLHLKSGISYLENDTILAGHELLGHPAFSSFHKIPVDLEESYAANSLWVNGTVLIPAGFDRTMEKIEKAGYNTISLHVSEFRKLDGGLSCLSLRF